MTDEIVGTTCSVGTRSPADGHGLRHVRRDPLDYDTLPVIAIYILMLVTRWLKDEVGGLEKQLAHNPRRRRSSTPRSGSDGFSRGHAQPGSRSLMYLTSPAVRGPRAPLRARGSGARPDELKGDRSVGGIRASLYNAMPLAGAEALANFMRTFAATRHPAV